MMIDWLDLMCGAGAEEASGQLVQHLARPGTSAAKGQGLGGSSVASASAAEASEDRSAGGKRKRLSETPGMEEGLHDDPDANVGRAVSCHSASSGTTSQVFRAWPSLFVCSASARTRR